MLVCIIRKHINSTTQTNAGPHTHTVKKRYILNFLYFRESASIFVLLTVVDIRISVQIPASIMTLGVLPFQVNGGFRTSEFRTRGLPHREIRTF